MAGPRVVIIGAGVVGAALADEISARGWTEVTVVDQGPLPATGGSSSHAPGLVFQTNSSKTMTELARYTVEKFCSLDVDGKPCFLQVGGLEVATTPERLTELHRRHGWITAWGIEARLLTADECVEQHPLVNPDRVLGGLLVPTDGLAKAVLAVEAQVRRATERGVTFLPHHEVLDVQQVDGQVTGVVTDQGEIPADIVVCCAGIWGPKIARMVGLNLPLTPLAHQLAWTGPVPALAGQTEEAVRPILRHQDADLYYRDRFDAIGIGYYGHRPMPITADEILSFDEADTAGGMPSVLKFTEDDFEPAWTETQSLLPSTKDAKVEEGINGLFSFTTDNFPSSASPRTSRASGWRRRSGSPTPRASAVPSPSCWSTVTAPPSTCTSATSTASSRTSCPRSTSWPATARTSWRCTTSSTRSSRPGTPRDPHQPLPHPPARTGRLLPGGERLGAPAVVRGQRVPGGRPFRADSERLGGPVLVPDRRRRGPGDPRDGRDVRHDGPEAPGGDRPR